MYPSVALKDNFFRHRVRTTYLRIPCKSYGESKLQTRRLEMNVWTNIFAAFSDNDRSLDLICRYVVRRTTDLRLWSVMSTCAELTTQTVDVSNCTFWTACLPMLCIERSRNSCVLLAFRRSLFALILASTGT